MSSNGTFSGGSDSYFENGRPPVPRRPQRQQSIPQLTIGRSTSSKSIKISDLQAQATTEVTEFSSESTKLPQNLFDTSSIYSTLNQFEPSSLDPNSDTYTIRTNPTLTIYSDEEEDDVDSIDGSNSKGFINRLGKLIGESEPDLRLSILEDKVDSIDESKHFFIISSAGKPIYSMSNNDDENDDAENDEKFSGYSGVIQTVISAFQLDGSKLKSLVAGSTRFAILNQSPIILVAISNLHETEHQLFNQLDLLHSFLLSTLSKPHIVRSFQNKEGFDLRKHLGRSDHSGLNSLCNEMKNLNPGILLGALQSVRLRSSTRKKISHVLLKNKTKDLLYGVLVAPGGKLINIMRPKNHTLHTTDLQILFSVVFNQMNLDDEELWLPICLPKFNSNGFLYAFVKYIGSFTLILISADKTAFFQMREAATNILADLKKQNLLIKIDNSISRGLSTIEIPAPLVYHFIYKSKRHLQYVMPKLNDIKSLQTYYLKLHSSVNRHNRINVSYIKWERKNSSPNNSLAGLSWVTPNYEIYLLTGSITKKDVLVQSAKAIVNWCKKYEDRLFVCEGATF